VNWTWFAVIYDSSMLGCRCLAAKQVGGIVRQLKLILFVAPAGFVFLNYCSLLLRYRISRLLDDVCWMVCSYILDFFFYWKVYFKSILYRVLTAFVSTVVLGHPWPSSPLLPRIIESCLYIIEEKGAFYNLDDSWAVFLFFALRTRISPFTTLLKSAVSISHQRNMYTDLFLPRRLWSSGLWCGVVCKWLSSAYVLLSAKFNHILGLQLRRPKKSA
jgi:hypothetical protein